MVVIEGMSVFPGIIRNEQVSAEPNLPNRGISMPGRGRSCPPGCDCKRHNRARRIDWDNPEERAEYNRKTKRAKYAADPGPQIEASRRWREKNPGRRAAWGRVANREFLYGMSDQGLADWMERQGGRCYIGGELLDLDNPRGIHVDHDHSCCPRTQVLRQVHPRHRVRQPQHRHRPLRRQTRRPAIRRRSSGGGTGRGARERISTKPVQAELFDINRGGRRRGGECVMALGEGLGRLFDVEPASAGRPARCTR